MSDPQIYYVDVLLPLHIPDCYTYRVPQEYNGLLQPGQRVVVQFGRQRIYSALVRRLHTQQPPWRAKYIMAILDTAPSSPNARWSSGNGWLATICAIPAT